jgi:hypothetical protein
MGKQNRWLLLGILALCAIACYAVGFISGVIVFIAIGAILELSFWFGVFRKFQKLKK